MLYAKSTSNQHLKLPDPSTYRINCQSWQQSRNSMFKGLEMIDQWCLRSFCYITTKLTIFKINLAEIKHEYSHQIYIMLNQKKRKL